MTKTLNCKVENKIIPVKLADSYAELPLPFYASEQAAGMDLLACIDEDVVIKPLKRALIPTGLSIALPDGFEAQIRPRSGLAWKNGITIPNSPGTIDADYRGEISVILLNLGEEDFVVSRGMRIAQMVFARYEICQFEVVEILDDTERGDGGFGHSGVK